MTTEVISLAELEADRNYDRKDRVLDKLKDIYYWEKYSHKTHAQHVESLKALWESEDYQNLTQYYKGYIDGVREAWDERRNREDFVVRHKLDGVWRSIEELKVLLENRSWSEVTDCGRFWKDDPTKPWYPTEETQ